MPSNGLISDNDEQLINIKLKSELFDKFQFSGLISDNDEQPMNIPLKSVSFDTFQISNTLIFDNDEQPMNIPLKSVLFNTHQSSKFFFYSILIYNFQINIIFINIFFFY